MTSHTDELASSQPVLADQQTGMPHHAPQSDEVPPAHGPTESGKTIFLHWCILIGGIAFIVFIAGLFG